MEAEAERTGTVIVTGAVAREPKPEPDDEEDEDTCGNTSGEEDAAAPANLEAEQQLVDELMALDPEQIGLYAGSSRVQPRPQVSNGLLDVEDLGLYLINCNSLY